jgi:hypothetical protein
MSESNPKGTNNALGARACSCWSEIDLDPNVVSWATNDHLRFEIMYVFKGVLRKYRPNSLIRLKNGTALVLGLKSRDLGAMTELNRSARKREEAVPESAGAKVVVF